MTYLYEHLWNCSQVNAIEHLFIVNIGSGNGMVSVNGPLPETMMTQIYGVTGSQWF